MKSIEQIQAEALDAILDICLQTSRKTQELKNLHRLTVVPQISQSEAFSPKELEEMLYIKDGTVYQRADGRYCAEIYILGEQRQVTIRKYKTAAVNRLNDVAQLKSEGRIQTIEDFQKACRGLLKPSGKPISSAEIVPFPNQSELLFAWIETWLATYKEGKVNRRYFIQLRSNFNVHIKPNFKNLPILGYPPIELQRGLDQIQLPRMKENARSVLFGAFQKAYELDMIPKNYMQAVEYKKHKRTPRKAFTKSDQALFVHSAKQHPYGALFLFQLYSGARPAEARQMKWSFLLKEKDLIFINGTKNQYAKRYIPYFQKLRDLIATLQQNSDFLFPIDAREASNAFHEILKSAGLSGYEQYSLRHSFATRANEAGIDLKTIATWMGHNDTHTTEQIYIATQDEHQIAMKNKLDKYEF